MTPARRAGVLLGLTVVVTIGPWFSRAPAPTSGAWPVAAAWAAAPATPRRALLMITGPATFRDFMSQPAFRQLARAGGAGLVATNQTYRSDPREAMDALLNGTGPTPGAVSPSNGLASALHAAGIPACDDDVRSQCAPTWGLTVEQPGEERLAEAAREVRAYAAENPNVPTLIIALAVQPSAAMNRAGDEVTPIVMSEGMPAELFPASGPMHSLTSDTTRYPGLVANVDVAPTILSFFHVPVPSSMTGSPIRVTGSSAPFTLDRRQIQQRTVRLPVQLGEVVFVSIAGVAVILALLVIDRRGRVSSGAALAWQALVLFVAALPIPLALGGLLPGFTYAGVTAWVVLWAGALTALALAARRSDRMAPLSFVGAAGLVAIVVDLAFGGHGLRVPLLGGTMFEGVRMYGLPNAFISTLLASGLFVAARMGPEAGLTLLLACGLVAGAPELGADVGGSITLFAAAGLWWQLRRRGRLGVRELLIAGLVTVAGLAVVLLVNRFLAPSPTHATRFVERTGTSPSSAVAEIRHRLGVGVHQVAHYPASLIPLIGVAAMLWVALRGPGIVGRGLAEAPPWREVVIVLALTAAIAYVVNDTGMAAAAPAFLYGMAALAYPAFSCAVRPPPTGRRARQREASAA